MVTRVFSQTWREEAAQYGGREGVRELALRVSEHVEVAFVAPWGIADESKDSAVSGATRLRFPHAVGHCDESAREGAGGRYEDFAQGRADIDVRGRRGWRRGRGRRGPLLGSWR